ncbi:hypothetical protein [Enhygromyxa salina]|uniref:hypothetical protein n=1 Tax=Enhygromyxa salina TaxID=215803 RepID=UPI000D03A371|nr:hypothetical protein [Enhygromyxa salina]
MSTYGWFETRADIRLEVNSLKIVRANPSLKMLESLPEYPALKYNFMREDIAARKSLADMHLAEKALREANAPDRPRPFERPQANRTPTLPPITTVEGRIFLDESARQRWIEEASALADDTRKVTGEKKLAFDRIFKHLEEMRRYVVGAGSEMSDGNTFANVAKEMKKAVDVGGKEGESLAALRKQAELPQTKELEQELYFKIHALDCSSWPYIIHDIVCAELEIINSYPAQCQGYYENPDYGVDYDAALVECLPPLVSRLQALILNEREAKGTISLDLSTRSAPV